MLLENVPRRIKSIGGLELVPILKDGETSVVGEEMVHRARVELDANYGQEDAEYLFANQREIPVEFRTFYPVFPGTVWRSSDGNRYVPYLCWDGGRWLLDFYWLSHDWYPRDRLVQPRK